MIEYTFVKVSNLFIFHYLDKRITGANITNDTINNFDVDFNDIFFLVFIHYEIYFELVNHVLKMKTWKSIKENIKSIQEFNFSISFYTCINVTCFNIHVII